ncbi:MAG: YdeI/OmpD-associated family protein [Bacteroidia bacterium]|nr:YdeI/OmpD-associated family protein [Bacteroidia bacterium]
MNPEVDPYFLIGCGRCKLVNTPECKVHRWEGELKKLRRIILDCGLTEELKWSIPCYTFRGNNVLLLTAFNDYCCISFFKGALLADTENILSKPGENTQVARIARFTHPDQVEKLEAVLKAYIFEAVEVEKAGLKGTYLKNPEPLPEELESRFEELPELKAAFEALTQGRQRGYILYFSAPKQSKTRSARIEKYIPLIMAGKGIQD